MKFNFYTLSIFSLFIAILLNSCANKKDILYLQDIEILKEKPIKMTYENTLQPDDVLSIIVSSADNVGTSPFNLAGISNSENTSKGSQQIRYTIRQDGAIEYPVIGKITLAGQTINQAIETIRGKLKPYIKDPIILVEWLNFKFSVLGQVSKPGVFQITNERITILEAIAMAGDLTVYGKRKNILLIRENNGKRSTYTIDLTNPSILDKDIYYIKQNDLLIVDPNNPQVQASAFNQNLPIYVSIITTLITLSVLFKN